MSLETREIATQIGSFCQRWKVRELSLFGSVVRDDSKQLISFVIAQGGHALPVTYSGVVPDIFRPGIEVVVEGHYSGHGPFQAQTLLAKCPSKFQAATPAP